MNRKMDEFSLYYSIKSEGDIDEFKLFRERSRASGESFVNAVSGAPMPPTDSTVKHSDMRKSVVELDNALAKTKKTFSQKIETLKKRAQIVQREQDKLRKNLIKYNNFVKEKKFKVVEGEKVYEEETETQRNIDKAKELKLAGLTKLELARNLVQEAVEKREIFRHFLQSVVDLEKTRLNRYKDIASLMKRCETLVKTREQLKNHLRKLESEIKNEENQIQKFKDSQNERILDLSSHQNSLQDNLYLIQAKKDSMKRDLDVEENEKKEKKLKIANIKLSVLTLWQYVNLKKVLLRNEQIPDPSEYPDFDTQLEAINAHIEDLLVVMQRVKKAEDPSHYDSPMVSEFSEMRNNK